jgi:enoyl-CoA hydratase/carnithine racemase
MTPEPELLVEDRAGARWIILNRPSARNAQNEAMLRLLAEALDAVNRDHAVRLVVLAGHGPSFSAGHDVKEVVRNARYRANLATVEGRLRQELELFVRPVELLYRLRVPTICRVQGHCVAAALMLVGAADLVVASEDATFYSHVTRDMGASDVELPLLAWAVGERRAKQLLWASDTLDAHEAQRAGLVNWVVPMEELDEKVNDVVNRVLEVPPEALALSKLSLSFMEEQRGRTQAFNYHFLAHQLSHHTADAVELLRQRISELGG